jgi:sulfatase maturation enzyme AslB (radical SAM superfamily)
MKYKWLQVEATNKCNAWCPGCPRNNGGYGLADGLILEDLDENIFEQHLKNLPDLEVIDFCGTYGDAIAASNIKTLLEIAKHYAPKIIIRTNGSLRNEVWWAQLADILNGHDHEVWFCLDGLADTHAIYRQGTNFNTIIDNATVFMRHGGVAVWQFIPWEHNQHQIKDAVRMSQLLGFKRFEFVRDVRNDFNARDYRTGAALEIKPWKENQTFSKYEKNRSIVLIQDCQHLIQPSVYLNANGTISTCCWYNLQHQFDTLDQVPDIATELPSNPRSQCIKHCGSPNV